MQIKDWARLPAMAWALTACGGEPMLPSFVTSHGVEVYAYPDASPSRAQIEGATQGVIAGVRTVFGEESANQFVRTLRSAVAISAYAGLQVSCGSSTARGCTTDSGFHVMYATGLDENALSHCPEVVVAHEFAHVAAHSLGVANSHANRELFGPDSVSDYGMLAALEVCRAD